MWVKVSERKPKSNAVVLGANFKEGIIHPAVQFDGGTVRFRTEAQAHKLGCMEVHCWWEGSRQELWNRVRALGPEAPQDESKTPYLFTPKCGTGWLDTPHDRDHAVALWGQLVAFMGELNHSTQAEAYDAISCVAKSVSAACYASYKRGGPQASQNAIDAFRTQLLDATEQVLRDGGIRAAGVPPQMFRAWRMMGYKKKATCPFCEGRMTVSINGVNLACPVPLAAHETPGLAGEVTVEDVRKVLHEQEVVPF